jgi:hypothetical protein
MLELFYGSWIRVPGSKLFQYHKVLKHGIIEAFIMTFVGELKSMELENSIGVLN